ncbi:MAG TPA: site-2 protease family protein [Thermoanaerobaculia bacterium]|nr:site-2 protease family protein [Thermoanaerobaculia bacterium]HUM29706.1 site-2 protease family protein [Thermoanaerobaculia bacterium]HXK67006.1 site-2 protease family protein [Thermoanaerobaculia bacterium]
MNWPEAPWFLEPPPRFQHRYFIHIALLLLTLITTTLIGGLWFGTDYENAETLSGLGMALIHPENLIRGLLFSLPTLFILLAHEMGHYFACRIHRVDATLPYFIPVPFGIGTLGAFIKIKEPIPSKRQLFDIGAGGPLAGFVATLPFLVIGIALSTPTPIAAIPEQSLQLGTPLLFLGLSYLFHSLPEGMTIMIHPLAFAGWVGLLATSLNLLPFGQLDGGHILYSVIGKRQHRLALPLYIFLVAMGVFWWGWWLWAVILIFIGLRHPRMWDEPVPLDLRRKILAIVVFVVFLISFMPIPVSVS